MSLTNVYCLDNNIGGHLFIQWLPLVQSVFFNMFLVVIVTTILSAASGEESGTVLTLTNDPVAEHFHTSEHINQEINEELQWKNMIFDLFEQLRVANKEEERSIIEEDISKDFGLTSDVDIQTTEDNLAVKPRIIFNAPTKTCKPNEQLIRRGECVEII